MRTIRVHYDNGDTVTTRINGTEAQVRAYYVGQTFNLGDGAGGDLLATATSVEFLDSARTGALEEVEVYRCLHGCSHEWTGPVRGLEEPEPSCPRCGRQGIYVGYIIEN